jgi:hypothetical protein
MNWENRELSIPSAISEGELVAGDHGGGAPSPGAFENISRIRAHLRPLTAGMTLLMSAKPSAGFLAHAADHTVEIIVSGDGGWLGRRGRAGGEDLGVVGRCGSQQRQDKENHWLNFRRDQEADAAHKIAAPASRLI